jgi:hypothetical protein
MVPKKSKSKPSIDQAIMEWMVIFNRVLDTMIDIGAMQSDLVISSAAKVSAEIWKGVDHGYDA